MYNGKDELTENLFIGAAGSLVSSGITALFAHNAETFGIGAAFAGVMALAGVASNLCDKAEIRARKKENELKV